jgi:hypothetical protein
MLGVITLVFMVVGVMLTLVLVQYVGAKSLNNSSFLQLVIVTYLGMALKNQLWLMNVAQHIVDPRHV